MMPFQIELAEMKQTAPLAAKLWRKRIANDFLRIRAGDLATEEAIERFMSYIAFAYTRGGAIGMGVERQ